MRTERSGKTQRATNPQSELTLHQQGINTTEMRAKKETGKESVGGRNSQLKQPTAMTKSPALKAALSQIDQKEA